MPYNHLGPRHRAVVRLRTEQGWSASRIAEELEITPRSVQRIRGQLGISKSPGRRITPDEDARIRDMLEDGCSIYEVARTVGRHVRYLQTKYRGLSKGSPMCDSIRLRRQLGLELR